MKIPAHYYFQSQGFSGIVRISSQWREDPSGLQNEYIDEKIAAKKNDDFCLIGAQLEKRMLKGERFKILNEEIISKNAYDSYCERHGGVIDTPQYREVFDKIVKTKQEIEKLYPSCPKCDTVMVERSGRHGIFWGCPTYPRCDGTRKHGLEIKEISRLNDRLSKLNTQLDKLEK